jgi:hypothetical protein
MRETWTDILVGSVRDVAQRLSLAAPRVLAALTLVLVGWAAAALARRLVARILRAADFDGRCARWGFTTMLGLRRRGWSPSEMAGRVVFWTLFGLGLLTGIEALEMPATAGLVAGAVRLLPNVVVAALVLLLGWLLSHFLAQAALIRVVNAQVAGAPVIAAAVRWLVLVFAGGVALTQLGIAREMVLLIFGIAFGGTVLALALAFGLGGRELAREVLEGWLRKREGDEEEDRISHV